MSAAEPRAGAPGASPRGPQASALAAVARAADASLTPFALQDPPPGEWEQRPGLSADRAFVVESVYEAFLLHYRGEPRAFTRDMDPDLRLLAGDSLYALGLERLAQLGDLDAVAELADLISGCAQAEAEGRRQDVPRLWEGTCAALVENAGADRQPGS